MCVSLNASPAGLGGIAGRMRAAVQKQTAKQTGNTCLRKKRLRICMMLLYSIVDDYGACDRDGVGDAVASVWLIPSRCTQWRRCVADSRCIRVADSRCIRVADSRIDDVYGEDGEDGGDEDDNGEPTSIPILRVMPLRSSAVRQQTMLSGHKGPKRC